MKKTRFLALALVAALMIMGAGYAYWSDTLTINATVETGEFDVNVSKIWLDQTASDGDLITSTARTGYQTAELKAEEGKNVNISMNNVYPNDHRHTFKIFSTNDGTIPVVFDNLDFNWSNFPEELKEHLWVNQVEVKHEDQTVFHKNTYTQGGNRQLRGLENWLANNLNDLRLEPGETVEIRFDIRMDGVIDNDDNAQGQSGDFGFVINWAQHNKK